MAKRAADRNGPGPAAERSLGRVELQELAWGRSRGGGECYLFFLAPDAFLCANVLLFLLLLSSSPWKTVPVFAQHLLITVLVQLFRCPPIFFRLRPQASCNMCCACALREILPVFRAPLSSRTRCGWVGGWDVAREGREPTPAIVSFSFIPNCVLSAACACVRSFETRREQGLASVLFSLAVFADNACLGVVNASFFQVARALTLPFVTVMG